MTVLRIDDLLANAPVDLEAHLDAEQVERYSAMIDTLPPVVVFAIPEGMLLADGYHRVAAARLRGLETVEAEVRRGSRHDALRYAATVGAAERGISPEEAASYIIRRRSQGLWPSEDRTRGLPTCLTLVRSSAVCSRCKLLGRRYKGIARGLPVAHKTGWLVLGSRPAVENGVRSGSKEVRARMKVLIGIDPHKASVAVAVVDEVGEFVESATFAQNRAGLRTFEDAGQNGSPSVALGGGERWRSRSAPGGEVGSGRRVVGGGRATQALGAGAGALERQCPQKR
jgi:hypothetical protein